MALCVVVTDSVGTPSVIGPFDDHNKATEYANKINKDYEGLNLKNLGSLKARIAQFNPPEA